MRDITKNGCEVYQNRHRFLYLNLQIFEYKQLAKSPEHLNFGNFLIEVNLVKLWTFVKTWMDKEKIKKRVDENP